jgi:hypothetical protein
MTRLRAALLALTLAPTAHAAPLYLGTLELETDDRAAMSAVIDHCTGLLGDLAPRVATEDPDSPVRNVLVIDLDALASGEGSGEAAGEGSGTGPSPDDAAEDGSQDPDLSNITLDDCRAAGVTF